MRINIIHMGFFYSGGGERVVLKQALHLRRRGHQVHVFSPVIRWEKCFPESLRAVMPEPIVPHFPLPFPFRDASAMIASAVFPFRMREMADCEVLLCHSQPSMWIGFKVNRLYGTPYVGYLHQLTTFIHRRPEMAGGWATKGDFLMLDGLLGVFGRPPARHLDRLCHKNASRLLFNSAWTRSLFEEEYGLSGDVCYPGIDVPSKPGDSLRENFIINASRHYPWKRIDLAFHVLKLLKATRPLLVVTGDETMHTDTLKRFAVKWGVADQVDFTGFIDDPELFSLYARAKAYIQTSIREPFGLGPLEAQSYGTPAVVWGDSGVKETVLDGETGFHGKPYDVNDFANKLEIVLTDQKRRREMSPAARVWASTFNWDTHVDLLEGVLDEEKR